MVDMKPIKEFVEKYPLISIAVAVITTFVIPNLLSGQGSMISGAIIQLGWCAQGNYVCILCNYFYITLVIFFIAVVSQSIISFRVISRVKYFLQKTRPAKFDFSCSIIDDRIIVTVYNNEFLYTAFDVIAKTEFAVLNNPMSPFKGFIKWKGVNEKTIIPRRKCADIVVATINKTEYSFTLHKTGGEVIFQKGKWYIPVYIQGIMKFWKMPVKVILNTGRDVVIEINENVVSAKVGK